MLWVLASVSVVCILAALSGYRTALLLAVIYGAVVLGWFFHGGSP